MSPSPSVGGRYRLLSRLGAGGTASVYEAVDPDGVHVAVKLLHAHLADSAARRSAFFEEVHAARSIEHPGIARILDSGVDEGERPVVWIAMDLVRGRTLAQIVDERGGLGYEDALAVARGLLEGLAAAHREGVVHRDVSPSNVMLDPDALGRSPVDVAASVRLLDFGLADIPGRTTAGTDALLSGDGAQIGVVASVPYAAPEHLRGQPISESSDVYQVAGTIFFALTARTPFLGEREDHIRGHLDEQPPRVGAFRPDIPPSVDRWLSRAWQKSPSARYHDATRMLAEMPVAGTGAHDHGAGASVVAPVERRRADARTRLLPAVAPRDAPVPVVVSARPRGPRVGVAVAALIGGAAIASLVVLVAVAGAGAPTAAPTSAPTASATWSPTPDPSPTLTAAAIEDVGRPVPDVSGLSVADATARLSADRLAVGAVTRVDAPRAADTVLESDPPPGTQVATGSVIALRVASGSNLVPALAGRRVDDAIAVLLAAGFASDVRPVAVGASDLVTSTEPGAGASLLLGTTVRLLVPTAPPTPTPTPVATATPTSSPAAG